MCVAGAVNGVSVRVLHDMYACSQKLNVHYSGLTVKKCNSDNLFS